MTSLLNSLVPGIAEDVSGNVWVSTEAGLPQLRTATQTFTSCTAHSDGDDAYNLKLSQPRAEDLKAQPVVRWPTEKA